MTRSVTQLFSCLALLLAPMYGWSKTPEPTAGEVEVVAANTAYWQAYNNCDSGKMEQLETSDLEFYHDSIGVTVGKSEFSNLVKNNICGNPDHKIRRSEVPGTSHVSLLRKEGKIYGAVLSGEHQFYVRDGNYPEYPQSRSRFTMLWTLSDQEWRTSRVLSFDHVPVPYHNKHKKINLSRGELKQFTGQYVAKDGSPFVVNEKKKHLELTIGSKTFAIFPFEKMAFFSEDEDLTFTFSPAKMVKANSIIVREHGAIVEEAARKPPE